MGRRGEIRWLLDLIEEHPAPLAYDLRSRFGISIEDLGESVSPRESVWLVDELLKDPSAHLTAALLGWAHPVSQEWVLLADLRDFTVVSGNKKNKPTRRPWDGVLVMRPRLSDAVKAELRLMAGR